LGEPKPHGISSVRFFLVSVSLMQGVTDSGPAYGEKGLKKPHGSGEVLSYLQTKM